MLRVVLESSTTPESPDNKNNHFKVRFPASLQLENGTWEIALLLSLSQTLMIETPPDCTTMM